MKVRKLVWPMFLLCVVWTAFLPACEEKPEGEPEAAGETGGTTAGGAALKEKKAEEPPPPPAGPKPEEVCTTLVTAIKAKDEAKVLAMSTPGTATAVGAEGAKEHLMTQLGSATCGSAKVEGDNAIVSLTAGEAAQEATFVKDGKDWKFDGAAYLTKYPPPDKHGKDAKGKGKTKEAKGKAKAKTKGKHKK